MKATQKESSKSKTTPVYSLNELAENSQSLLGVKSEVLTGALHGAHQESFGVQEAKQLVQQFLKRKVL
ncbi:hypothetical protein DFP94_101185 [Fontibacillus phaseoli]|uniref:YqzN/YkzM domain-containing protein n=1 Tax=Fontibacillus phaseoli TaxID=1416533 RepID=A0A369BNE3_9BACL|nr:hypothetical protein [Fontibacillus phaseoli]RCX22605.1 hypothetical protein DFP94_101185 [Fontibacillus phaseoli]